MLIKTCVLTGASSGIGQALAVKLAAARFRLVLTGRDEARLAETARLCAVAASPAGSSADSPPPPVTTLLADLSTVAGARALAADILAAAPTLDVLIHNAGVLPTERRLTPDGFEESFATNHLAPFVLNEALLPRLLETATTADRARAPARIVQVTAGLYVAGKIDLARGPYADTFHPFKTYGSSKLWNLLATMDLARELEGRPVTVNAVHPGVVNTRLGAMSGLKGTLLDLVKRLWATPEKGARGPLRLAVSPDLATTTGRYFDKLAPQPLRGEAADPSLGRAVVQRTAELLAPR